MQYASPPKKKQKINSFDHITLTSVPLCDEISWTSRTTRLNSNKTLQNSSYAIRSHHLYRNIHWSPAFHTTLIILNRNAVSSWRKNERDKTRQGKKLQVLARGIEVHMAVIITTSSAQLQSDTSWSPNTTDTRPRWCLVWPLPPRFHWNQIIYTAWWPRQLGVKNLPRIFFYKQQHFGWELNLCNLKCTMLLTLITDIN